jgi:hypothetical protein
VLIKILSFSADKNDMYITSQTPPALTISVSPEVSPKREMESQALKLQPNQIVPATVVEGGLEKVVLNIKDRYLEAKTHFPLRSGRNLSLQVLATDPQIQLRIIENSELNHLLRLLHSLDQNIKILPLIEGIQRDSFQSFNPFSKEMQTILPALILLLRSSPGKLTGKDLAQLWDKFGLNLEALLKAGKTGAAKTNFKNMLFMHAIEIHKQGEKTENIQNILDLLNLYQFCRYKLSQEHLIFLPLPFSFLEDGYLLAEKEKHHDQEDIDPAGRWKITLYLKLSFLGNLKIVLLFENLTLCLRIMCDSKDKAEIISKSLSHLQNHLTAISLDSFSVGIGAEDPIRNLIQHLAHDGDHFITAKA